jgi:hypothetical protein
MSKPTPPVVIYDEDTPREHRATRRVVKHLPPEFRFDIARCFIGWHVAVDTDAGELRGYVEGSAHSHNRTSDVLLLTLAGALHELDNMHAIPLATIRSITTLGRGPAS